MNSSTRLEVAVLAAVDLASIDADCARGFSAVLPAHRRALQAHLAAGGVCEDDAYARALLLKVEQLLADGLSTPSAAALPYLDESLVLDLEVQLPEAA